MTTLKNIAAEYLWLWLAALVGLAIYIGCQWMTPWYGYTAIVRPPEIPTPLSELTGNTVKSPSLFGLNSLPTMVQEAQAYVEFRYVKKIKEPGMKAFIKSATSSKDSPYLELVVYGVSLKAASDYLDEVLVQLRKAYQAKVQDGRADVEKQIAVLTEKITQEKEILRRTQDVGKRLGFSPTLLETSMQLERDLLKVQLNRELLIGSISDQKLFNFRLVEARPLDSRRPVFPRPKLFAAVGAILAASVLFFFGFGRKPKIAPALELHAAEKGAVLDPRHMDRHRQILLGAGLIYLFTFVVEGVLRLGLVYAGLEWTLYARDGVPLYGMALLLTLPPQSSLGRTTAGFLALLAVSILVGLVFVGRVNQVFFGAKLFLPILMGWSVGAFDRDFQFIRSPWFTLFLILAAIGILLEFWMPLPWKGMSYKIGGVKMHTALQWYANGGFNRISGFARSSFSAAIQVLLLTLIVNTRLQLLWLRAIIWVAAAVLIVLTTTKSLLLSWAFVIMASYFFTIPRAAKMARYLPGWLVAVIITLPFAANYLLEELKLFPDFYRAANSFGDRVNEVWPLVFNNVDTLGNWVIGRGMGSVGVAQTYFEPLLASPADNIFLYLFSIFGVVSVAMLMFVALLASRARNTVPERFAFLILVSALVMGVSGNVIEDGFYGVFIGYSLSLLIRQGAATQRAHRVPVSVAPPFPS